MNNTARDDKTYIMMLFSSLFESCCARSPTLLQVP
jgi:hypothetical protein